MATYHQQTAPLVDFYHKRRLLCSVDASLDSTSIFERINKMFVHMKSKFCFENVSTLQDSLVHSKSASITLPTRYVFIILELWNKVCTVCSFISRGIKIVKCQNQKFQNRSDLTPKYIGKAKRFTSCISYAPRDKNLHSTSFQGSLNMPKTCLVGKGM